MKLVVAATFGSLPEATIAFSSLTSAGFNAVAGFNMNTPGTANGMAPSAYPVLVPEPEGEAARSFLSEAQSAMHVWEGAENEENQGADQPEVQAAMVLSIVRPVARFLVIGTLVMWFALNLLMCSRG